MDRILKHRQIKVMELKEKRHKGHSTLLFIALLIPVFWLGWKIHKAKWVDKMVIQIVDVTTLAFFSYFRRQVYNFFK